MRTQVLYTLILAAALAPISCTFLAVDSCNDKRPVWNQCDTEAENSGVDAVCLYYKHETRCCINNNEGDWSMLLSTFATVLFNASLYMTLSFSNCPKNYLNQCGEAAQSDSSMLATLPSNIIFNNQQSCISHNRH